MQISSTQSSAMNHAQEALNMASKARPEIEKTEQQAEATPPPEGTAQFLNAKA